MLGVFIKTHELYNTMDIHMNKYDIQMFKNYLKHAKVYFEWGSGGSTCYVSQQPHIQKIYSVESDYNFAKKLQYLQNVDFIYCEMD